MLTTYSIIILATIFSFGPGDQSQPENSTKKPKKIGRLVTAIGKVNKKLLKKASELDKSIIDESGLLKGRFQISPKVSNCDSGTNGALEIIGELTVDSGSAERFKTEDERKRLAAATKILSKAKDDAGRVEMRFKQEWTRRRKHGGKILSGPELPGWYNIHTGAHITDAEYEQRLADKLRDAKTKKDAAQESLNAIAGPINERITAEKLKADTVQAHITIPAALAKNLDRVALASSTNPSLYVKVITYEAAPVADKASSGLRISELTLKAVDVHDRLKKKA